MHRHAGGELRGARASPCRARRALSESAVALGPDDLLFGDQTMESGDNAVMSVAGRIRAEY